MDPKYILTATKNGNIRIVEDYLRRGGNPNVEYDDGNILLRKLVDHIVRGRYTISGIGHDLLEIMDMLIGYGANVNFRGILQEIKSTFDPQVALHIIRSFAKAGANLNITAKFNRGYCTYFRMK